MPIYEFECKKCGFKFERLLTLAQSAKPQECPSCHKEAGERVISAPSLQSGGSSWCGPSGFG